MSEEINKLIECLKDNIPVDYTRSCDSSDGIGHYNEDEDSWQYQLYNYITNLQQENKQLKESYCNRTDCSGRLHDSRKYPSVKQQLDLYKSVLDEIRELIDKYEMGRFDYLIPVFEIKEILDKVKSDDR